MEKNAGKENTGGQDQNFTAGELYGTPTPIYAKGRRVGTRWRDLHVLSETEQPHKPSTPPKK